MKILDFGLAPQDEATHDAFDTRSPTLARPTDAGAVMGTAGYMSPEQVRGHVADARSDFFSLGCVAHEMLTGERAFLRETAAETMTARRFSLHVPSELGRARLGPILNARGAESLRTQSLSRGPRVACGRTPFRHVNGVTEQIRCGEAPAQA